MTATTWCALVPQKSFALAKGRIALPVRDRRALATAMFLDTVAALEATPSVAQVFVVWDDVRDLDDLAVSETIQHVVARRHHLNAAIDAGACCARIIAPACGLVVVPSDLPSLDPDELGRFLARASHHGRAFLADADDVGTSIIAATGGSPLRTAYGPQSRWAHAASGAMEIPGADLPTLRRDVDDLASLGSAIRLGCGPHTRIALSSIGSHAVVGACR